MRYVVIWILVCAVSGMMSGVPYADAAQLDATVPAESEFIEPTFQFLKIIYIQYPDGGELADVLHGVDQSISLTVGDNTQGIDDIIQQLNQNLKEVSSNAIVTKAVIEYQSTVQGNAEYAVIEYKIKLTPHITGHVLARSFETSIIDSNWRGLSVNEQVIVQTEYGSFDLNSPKAALDAMVPEIAGKLKDVSILEKPIMDASKILELQLYKWHSLFDNTAIISDAKKYNYTGEYVITHYSMGTCSVFTGLCDEKDDELIQEINLDKTYTIKTIKSDSDATIAFEGYVDTTVNDQGQEIFQTSLRSPGTEKANTEEFTSSVIYGMAAMSVVGGVIMFVVSNRKLKKDNAHQGQRGIDPAHLVSYETSDSAASYKTNRGESHLRLHDTSRMPV